MTGAQRSRSRSQIVWSALAGGAVFTGGLLLGGATSSVNSLLLGAVFTTTWIVVGMLLWSPRRRRTS